VRGSGLRQAQVGRKPDLLHVSSGRQVSGVERDGRDERRGLGTTFERSICTPNVSSKGWSFVSFLRKVDGRLKIGRERAS
ncbi:MAG: hypothetical protein IJY15_01220, partial [Thermoguttaceae bacterium]|nr:hypothetical protein [Thermoguttaceae bacterium]